jgi:Heterokaryon incompatibility protein (HET)
MDPEPIFDRLCSICRDVFNTGSNFGEGQPLERDHWQIPFHSVHGWQSAIQNGCHICSLLYDHIATQIATQNPLVGLDEFLARVKHHSADDSTPLTLSIWKRSFAFTNEKADFAMYVEEARGPSSPSLVICPARLVKSGRASRSNFIQPQRYTTKSHASLGQARDWLQHCLLGHDSCDSRRNETRVNRALPTRLLDTGKGNDELAIRLVSSSALDTAVPYIALSHCWGGDCGMKLTRGNAAAFARCIEISSLPKTFLEAVSLAKELGIRYLWIDALCIMQDSEEDWRLEAARMRDVYSNATLTVAATASRNSHGGLFYTRSPLMMSPCFVAMERNGLQGEPLIAYRQEMFEMFEMFEIFERIDADMAPLGTRGWAIQERLLSRRILHCAKN